MFKRSNGKATPPGSRLFAAAALAVVLGLGGLAAVQPAAAADGGNTTDVTIQVATDDGNLAWSAPTQVPFKATSAGTLIGPSADSIAIKNLSAFPIRVKEMDTRAEAPFNLVDDVEQSSGNNDIMMAWNGVQAKPQVELADDGTWAMGYAGNADGTDVLPLTVSGAKIARVTADLSAAKKAATVTWTVAPTVKEVKQPGATEPGGDTGAASEAVQAAVAKDAADWTLDDQKTVAEDIAAKGEASPAYAKAKAAMDNGTEFSMQLTDGSTLTYKIIGINHDDLADSSGKAGLTFFSINVDTNDRIRAEMNSSYTNVGGWEASELRAKMNSGEIWNLMPSEFQSKVKTVKKLSNNVGGGAANKDATVTATADKLFLLSYSELVETPWNGYYEYTNEDDELVTGWSDSWKGVSWIGNEGTQYEAFKGKVNNHGVNDCLQIGDSWWERSVAPNDSGTFLYIEAVADGAEGDPSNYRDANIDQEIYPAFCF